MRNPLKYRFYALRFGLVWSLAALIFWTALPVCAHTRADELGSDKGHETAGASTVSYSQLVKVSPALSFTAKQMALFIQDYYAWPGQDISNLIATATSVNAYSITYRTHNAAGQAITASGLVALPSPANALYPIVQYHHGTQFNNQDVPSNPLRSPEALCTMALFAAHGYVLSLPDYPGQGEGHTPHPYLQARPMAKASADMLKAVAELCSRLKVNTNSQLFICGLSEGGYATMALQRLIESDPAVEPFQLTASAPMAGPYDLRAEWRYLTTANPPGSTPILAHSYLSYKKAYLLKDSMASVFLAPYDRTVTSIDNGRHDENEMNQMLPKTIQELMRPSFLAAVTSGEHVLDEEMEGNSTFNFKPSTPTRLYHGRDDELVPFSISETTCAHMRQLGASDVEVVDIGSGVSHEYSFIPSTLMAKQWFDSF